MMRLNDPELTIFVELSAKALDLSISSVSHAGVLANARILADHAARVMAFELPPETRHATEFEP